MEEKNGQLEEKVWLNGAWRTPSEAEAHMETVSEMVSNTYDKWARAAEYHSGRTQTQ